MHTSSTEQCAHHEYSTGTISQNTIEALVSYSCRHSSLMQCSVRHIAEVVPDLPHPLRHRIIGSWGGGGARRLSGCRGRASLWPTLDECSALLRALLVGEPRNAVALYVQHAIFYQRRARRPNGGEVVAGQREVGESAGRPGEPAERVGYVAVEAVSGQVQLLDAAEAGEGRRDRAGELVHAGVNDRRLGEHAELGGETAGELVVQEENLEKGVFQVRY
jgi:hypothetical protein